MTFAINSRTHIRAATSFLPTLASTVIVGLLAIPFIADGERKHTLDLVRVLIASTIIQAVPYLLLHINYSRALGGTIMEASPSADSFTLIRGTERHEICKADIKDAVRQGPIGLIGHKPSMIAWNRYYYLQLTLRDGSIIKLPSILICEKDYKRLGLSAVRNENDILPFVSGKDIFQQSPKSR